MQYLRSPIYGPIDGRSTLILYSNRSGTAFAIRTNVRTKVVNRMAVNDPIDPIFLDHKSRTDWLIMRNGELERSNRLLVDEMTELRRQEMSGRIESGYPDELLAAKHIGLVMVNMNGDVIDANDAFLRMVRYSREYLVERRLCWEEICLTGEVLQTCQRYGNYFPSEIQFIRKDRSLTGLVFTAQQMSGITTRILGVAIELNKNRSIQDPSASQQFVINK